jgi:beta-glucosidase-like glycosyl hydrolase
MADEPRTDDLLILQGTSDGFVIPVLDPDEDPADLTDWTARAQVRATRASTDILYEWSEAAGNVTVSGNEFTFTVAPEVSSAWAWRDGVYDVEAVKNTGEVVRLTQGTISVDAEVTRG